METKQLQLVTYEQAKKLKELGFDWEVTESYDVFSKTLQAKNPFPRNFNDKVFTVEGHELISAPTVTLALKWIRDEKNIICHTTTQMKHFHLDYRFLYRLNYAQIKSERGYLDYESAESALLDKLLTILEKEKEK